MPIIEAADGARLNYLDVGRGRPMVLLHGFGMRGAHWRLVLASMERRYRFILPDLRGFGGSHDACWGSDDVIDQAADDLHALLSTLNLDSPVLAGLSMGACTAMQYIGKYGDDAIGGYINIDQAPRVGNDAHWHWGLFGSDQARWFRRFDRLHASLDAHIDTHRYEALPRRLRWELEWVMLRFFGYAFRSRALAAGTAATVKLPWLGQYLLPRRNWSALIGCMRAYSTRPYDFRPGLARVRVPMAAMVGMQSRMYPAAGQLRFPDTVRHCRLVPFARAGHALPFEAPFAFRRAMHEAIAAI